MAGADKRGRRRRHLPDVAMPPGLARHEHETLLAITDRLEEAVAKADTASGVVERLAIYEQVILELDALRKLGTAWAIEYAEVYAVVIGERVGRAGETISRRYGEDEIGKLNELG